MNVLEKVMNVYRIKHWYYQLGLVLIGFAFVSPLSVEVIKILVLGFMLMAVAYSFNDYAEGKEKKKYFLIPIIITLLILPAFNYLQILVSFLAISVSVLYSMKPIALREKPFICSAVNAIAVPFLFLLGVFFVPAFNFSVLGLTLVLFSFVMIGQLFHEITHIKEDMKQKIATTAIFLGKQKTRYVCYLFLLMSLVFTLFIFQLNIVNLIFLVSTTLFVFFVGIEIKRRVINFALRQTYIISCTILGIIYILSFYL
jgi:4-hydroxybenzoate polyprenyltransferase